MPSTGKVTAAGPRQNYHLQFVTVPTADTRGAGMILHFDDENYFFGQLHEGFERSCIQRGISNRKMRNIFLSGTTQWQTHGGLLGFALTLADANQHAEAQLQSPVLRDRLHIHGAPKLLHTVACARRFVFRTGMPLTIHENTGGDFKWHEEPTFHDRNIRVWSIPVHGQSVTSEDVSASTNPAEEQALRRQVVSDMFDSDWRHDKLFEKRFKDISMPATVFLRDPDTKDLKSFRCVANATPPQFDPEQMVLVRAPWPATVTDKLPTTSNLPAHVSMSYVVKGYPQRGAFDPHAAKRLGVKPGPWFAQLAEGQPVTLANGTVITPDLVLGPAREGKGFAVFDIPSSAHLANLRSVLKAQPAGMLEGVAALIWILGPGVSSAADFAALLETLPTFKHIVNDVDTSPNTVAYESVATSSLLTAQVAPSHFPALRFNNRVAYHNDAERLDLYTSPLSESSGVSMARPGAKLSVQPNYDVDERESPPVFDAENLEDESLAVTLRKLLDDQVNETSATSELMEPEIVTLGTGSAQPSKYRNVSATLLRMPNNQGNYLLDCGENTLGQLRRMFTHTELQAILTDLRGIWISHLHADHHLGTVSVLLERAKAFDALGTDADRTIYLISERNFHFFTRDYSSVEPILSPKTGVVSIVSSQKGTSLDSLPFDFARTPCGLTKVESVPVMHCAGAQAVTLTFKDGFRVSFSGDCRPSETFCKSGMDSDVLIHEATFDNDLEGDAQAKRHSTTAEALGVAVRMRAKNVVLTHFSQRYHKVPNFDSILLPNGMRIRDEAVSSDAEATDTKAPRTYTPLVDKTTARPRRRSATAQLNIAIAFDHMRFKISEIPGLRDLYPKIQALFDEQELKAEERRKQITQDSANAWVKKRSGWDEAKKTGPRPDVFAAPAAEGVPSQFSDLDLPAMSKKQLKRQASKQALLERRKKSQSTSEEQAPARPDVFASDKAANGAAGGVT